MTPVYRVLANQADITALIADRLLRLAVTDEAGVKSDCVDIELDDRDAVLELPTKGARLSIFMGYRETMMHHMGDFLVDEVRASGPPDKIAIRAKAADLGGDWKEQKTREWDEITIGDVVKTIAGEHDMRPIVANGLADFYYESISQTDESDMHLLTRLGRDQDAIATVKAGSLLFTKRGRGLSASGQPLPGRIVRRNQTSSFNMLQAGRSDYGKVTATWQDRGEGEKKEVEAGDGSPVHRLRHVFPNEEEAQRAADAKLDEIKRGVDTLSLTFPGDATVAAETPVELVGFRPGVAATWSVTSVVHDIGQSGFTTRVQAEKPGA